MLRWLRWRLARRALAALHWTGKPLHLSSWVQTHAESAERFPPNAEPYERLAAFWNDFAGWTRPNYTRFLAGASDYYRQPINSVLDLACGTGLITGSLASRFGSIVGLDLSEAMLAEARRLNDSARTRYLHADFRDFSLQEEFDAIVCGGDSLNYLDGVDQLEQVMQRASEHLRPGGLFVFDVIDHQACIYLSRIKERATVDENDFEIYFFYDPQKRVGENRAVCGPTIESHRRIPIEWHDVARASANTGLHLVDWFSTKPWLLVWLFSMFRRFYVLRKPLSEGV